MKYDSATPYVASYVLVERDGKYAFVLRSNTPWMNDHYGLPSGKVDADEPYTVAAAREAKEEIGVDITPEDLRFIHVTHRRGDDSDWVDVYFAVDKWSGEAVNAEPDKHSELAWFSLDNLPKNTIPSLRFSLEQIQAGKQFSELGWQ